MPYNRLTQSSIRYPKNSSFKRSKQPFFTFPPQKARDKEVPSEKPAKVKLEHALLDILTHYQNKKLIPYNRLKLLENYDWNLEI